MQQQPSIGLTGSTAKQVISPKQSPNNHNIRYLNNDLKCMYFNARSITNKVDELQLCINDENPDVIRITETWLHEEIVDSELNAFDYTIYRHDRNNKQGGGAALLIKKSINSILRDDLINDFEEGIWCDIICNNSKTLIGVCYRSTTIELRDDNKLYALINKVSKQN